MSVRRILNASITLTLVAMASLSSAQSVTRVGERPIKRQEVMLFVQEQFAAADMDKDGALTKAELRSLRARLDDRDQAAFDRMAARSFDQADIDADGRIDRWEVDRRATQLFDLVDMDRDGIASVEEQSVAVALVNLDANDVENLLDQFGAR